MQKTERTGRTQTIDLINEASIKSEMEVLLGIGKLPKTGTPEYSELLPKLMTFSMKYIEFMAAQKKMTIPHGNNETMPHTSVNMLLGGIMKLEQFFYDVFQISDPKKNGRKAQLTILQIKAMSIVLLYEKKRWGGGNLPDREKRTFINDLLESVSRYSQ